MKAEDLPVKAGIVVKQINELNGKGMPVLVMFSADWCTQCRTVKPHLIDIANEGNVRVLQIDVDDNPEATTHFGVKNIPAFMLYRGGKRVGIWIGAATRKQLNDRLLSKL